VIPTRLKDEEFRAGWPAVLGCFGSAVFAWGFASFGQGVFLSQLQQTHGWSASVIGGATTVSFLVAAGLLPWVGSFVELFGPRIVLCGGTLFLGIGAIGVSLAAEPWQLYPCDLLMGFGWVGAGSTAISIALARWFERQRGLALSLALSGSSVGGFLVAPVLMTLSERQSFSVATTEVSLGLMAIVVPSIWLGVGARRVATLSSTASPTSSAPGALTDRGKLLRNVLFWSIAAPFALVTSAQVGVLVYRVSYLTPLLGTSGTAVALICTSVATLVSRLGFGMVIDRALPRNASAATFVAFAAAAGLLIAFPDHPSALYIGSVAMGVAVGNVLTLAPLIVQREFSSASFGAVLGLATAVAQIAFSSMPALLGIVYDWSGSYVVVLGICTALPLVAAVQVKCVGVRRPG
jgi:MFS family permease